MFHVGFPFNFSENRKKTLPYVLSRNIVIASLCACRRTRLVCPRGLMSSLRDFAFGIESARPAGISDHHLLSTHDIYINKSAGSYTPPKNGRSNPTNAFQYKPNTACAMQKTTFSARRLSSQPPYEDAPSIKYTIIISLVMGFVNWYFQIIAVNI